MLGEQRIAAAGFYPGHAERLENGDHLGAQ